MLPMPLIGQRRTRLVRIAGGFGRLDVLQRAEHVEEPHRDDHREIRQQMAAAERRDEVADDRNRQVEASAPRACRPTGAMPVGPRRAAVPSATATRPPGRCPLKRTRPK